MNDQQLETLKFVWAYVIENGQLTNGEWSYYGSGWNRIEGDYRIVDKLNTEFKECVRTVGIDWEKTKHPEAEHNYTFDGTDNPSSEVESLLGTVYLKNGSHYLVGVNNADARFVSYVDTLLKMMQDKQRIKDILGES